ncbi:hypothetical protein An14g05560 [Aspergillus niger]|uniref:Uncharacterized protein n=2 Tax=Aspergillus niger TaxID=5061 RepID=A2R3U9_ASPNC|nr:hypothetical protein An14g05560 [Aspergillus niger]CAK42117.1 hypothetical protein An14g05560 [Aspergillus niger]
MYMRNQLLVTVIRGYLILLACLVDSLLNSSVLDVGVADPSIGKEWGDGGVMEIPEHCGDALETRLIRRNECLCHCSLSSTVTLIPWREAQVSDVLRAKGVNLHVEAFVSMQLIKDLMAESSVIPRGS